MLDASPITNLATTLMESGGNGMKFIYEGARLGPAIGLKKLGCSVYVLSPGKIGFPYHAHSTIEEMCVILEGQGTLRQDGKEYPVKAGDIIGSPCGTAHQLINTSEENLKYLAVSVNEIADVVMYPDSGKIGAVSGAFGKAVWHFTKTSSATGYYDGEE